MIKRIAFTMIFITVIKFAYQYTEPIQINRSLEGCIYSNEKEIEEIAQVRVEGKLYRRIIGDDVFEGFIEVDGNREQIKTPISKSPLQGTLNRIKTSYYDVYAVPATDSKIEVVTLEDATFVIAKDFELLWGNMHGIDEKYEAKCYIAAPCKEKKDGNKIAQRIIGN
ncbi:hypothetical protein R9X47_16675 [Wukongibacter baidiensis]|uniref:hypothetical protein n=1 Tax=Wukongibacter baidiensis TaxID=1723361 RepID=UPI003D7F9FA6